MKTAQLFRKHIEVLALIYTTMMLIGLGVIFRENFMEDKLTRLCCFTVISLSVGVIFRENRLRLKLKIFIPFDEFFSPVIC